MERGKKERKEEGRSRPRAGRRCPSPSLATARPNLPPPLRDACVRRGEEKGEMI
jgi:hypothetical protein